MKKHRRSRGVEPVYLSRGQRIWLAGKLGLAVARLREIAGDPDVSPAMVREAEAEIRRTIAVRRRLREARVDG